MRKHLPFLSVLSGSLLLAATSFAQQDNNFAYAITDAPNQTNGWMQLRVLNMGTGTYSGTLINGMAANQVAFDAFTKKQYAAAATVNQMGFPEQPAFSSGVAALAFDQKNGRI